MAMKPEIEIEEPEQTVDTFVFDRSSPYVKALLKAGIPAAKLQQIEDQHRAAADEVGEAFPVTRTSVVEKRR